MNESLLLAIALIKAVRNFDENPTEIYERRLVWALGDMKGREALKKAALVQALGGETPVRAAIMAVLDVE